MDRADVIQKLMPKVPAPSYLEIGVQNGYTFHSITAHSKVAVDPSFAFDVPAAQAAPENAGCRYYQITSDAYFSDVYDGKEQFDLVFIDGHHTFDQTLKDLMGAICCLAPGGIIIVDDVLPVSYASSISDIVHFSRFREAIKLEEGSWMGDVYKVLFFINQYLPLFNYATVAENHGQTVMWREQRPSTGVYVRKVEAICRLEYSDVILEKDLFNLQPFEQILAAVTKQRG